MRGRGGYQRGRGGHTHFGGFADNTQQQENVINEETKEINNFKAGNGSDQRPEGENRIFFYNGKFHCTKPQVGIQCSGESKSWYRSG